MPEALPRIVEVLRRPNSSRDKSAKDSLYTVLQTAVCTSGSSRDYSRWSLSADSEVCFNEGRDDEEQFLITARKGGYDVLWIFPGPKSQTVLISFGNDELADTFRLMDMYGITGYIEAQRN